MIGIRLLWMLNSEENWNKIYYMLGYFWIIGGICMILGSNI